MDREAKEEYHVVIQAKDMGGHMGGLSGTTKVTITLTDVNDNPPKFPQSKSAGLVFTFQWCHSQLSSLTHPCYTQLSRRNLG
jgi:cadherin 11 type 2 (OB-cadherin)